MVPTSFIRAHIHQHAQPMHNSNTISPLPLFRLRSKPPPWPPKHRHRPVSYSTRPCSKLRRSISSRSMQPMPPRCNISSMVCRLRIPPTASAIVAQALNLAASVRRTALPVPTTAPEGSAPDAAAALARHRCRASSPPRPPPRQQQDRPAQA